MGAIRSNADTDSMKKMPLDRFKTLALKIALSLALTVSLFYGTDWGLRVLDAETILPNGRIGETLYTWGHPVTFNRLGFRDHDFETPKPHGTYRIMVLGDSFVFGTGLAPEERFTNILERKLDEVTSGKKFEVVNFGREGACTKAELDTLTEYVSIVEPDFIIVGYVSNDTQCDNRNGSFPPTDTKLLSSVLSAFTDAKLYYWGRLFRNSFFSIEEKLGRTPSWSSLIKVSYAEDSPDWHVFLDSLNDIIKISEERGLPPPVFAVLNHGIYSDRPVDYTNPDEQVATYLAVVRQAEAAAKDIGFATHNYEQEILSNFPDGRFTINRFDNHPSAKLNKVYAEKLFEVIMETYKKPIN